MTDKNTADKHAIDNNVAQGIAAYIDYLNQLRVSTLMDTLRQILNNETGQLKDLAERQANALTPDEHLKGWKNQQLRLIIMVLLIC